jgi:hypothetical protein
MPNKPQSRQCINVTTGKKSYLVLRKKGPPFPALFDSADPKEKTLLSVTVTDVDNGFSFTATPLPQSSQGGVHRLALKLESNAPGGAGDPIDGLLGITLLIVQTLTGGFPTATTLEPATDVPVDYISDPLAP